MPADRTKPTAPGQPVVTEIDVYGNATVTVTESTDNIAVAGYIAFVDGSVVEAARGDSNVIELSKLTTGTHSVAVAAFDAAGNISDLSVDSGSFYVDLSEGVSFENKSAGLDGRKGYITIGDSWIGASNFGGSLSSITSIGTTATATASSVHGLLPGMYVLIENVDQAGYAGFHKVLTIPTTTEFTFTTVDADIANATSPSVVVYVIQQKVGDRNFAYLANCMSNQRLKYLANWGVGGDKIADTASLIDSALNPANNLHNDIVKIVFCMVGINDIANDRTYEQITVDYLNLFDKLKNVERVIFMLPATLSASHGSWTALRGQTLSRVHIWLHENAGANDNFIVIDSDRIFTDAANVNGDFKSGYSLDGIHPSKLGALQLAKAINTNVLSKMPDVFRSWPTSQLSVYSANNLSPQLNDNPTMQGVGGNAWGTGASGVSPDGYTASSLGGGSQTVAFSVNPKTDGTGNYLRCVINAVDSLDRIDIQRSANLSSRVSAGDRVIFAVSIDASSVSGLLRYYQVGLQVTAAGVTSTIDAIASQGTDVFGEPNFFLRFETPVFIVPDGLTSMQIKCQVVYNGVGAGTFDFSDADIINLSKI